ncbi:hypothetical protein V6N11_016729 [Hibiscus sabdariffa]|uniref:MORF/ORRM1/DAG-like MORF domain-containing protein n=1 Tax=Hibiscus sabdariffa TaxID=183260 RepID=A0ABR2TVX8_9ROSI
MATSLNPSSLLLPSKPFLSTRPQLTPPPAVRVNSLIRYLPSSSSTRPPRVIKAAALDSDYSPKRSSSNEPRETIMLPGCDYNHWLIVMEFPKDPAPTREQMIETYLNTLATVLGSMEEAKKNMYAFSTTTYTGFQCTVSEETSEKFKGLPGVLWVLPDSYIDVKNKDYGGDKYINGEKMVLQPDSSGRSKKQVNRNHHLDKFMHGSGQIVLGKQMSLLFMFWKLML